MCVYDCKKDTQPADVLFQMYMITHYIIDESAWKEMVQACRFSFTASKMIMSEIRGFKYGHVYSAVPKVPVSGPSQRKRTSNALKI